MKSDKAAKIVASIITLVSIFFFYISYNSVDMVSKVGFAIVGVWSIYIAFGSYIRQKVVRVLRKGDDN